MTKSIPTLAVALLLTALATPVLAQAAIQEPGAYAFYHPNADVLAGRGGGYRPYDANAYYGGPNAYYNEVTPAPQLRAPAPRHRAIRRAQ
jgi:hypothetical protein